MYDADKLRRLAVVILSEPMAMGNNLLATVNNNKLKTRVGSIYKRSILHPLDLPAEGAKQGRCLMVART
jgi:hypothetical protein